METISANYNLDRIPMLKTDTVAYWKSEEGAKDNMVPHCSGRTSYTPGEFLQYNTEPAAYWRFEEGPVDTVVSHTGADGDFDGQPLDSTGNGHPMSTWTTNAEVYRTDIPTTDLPQNVGVNNFSLENGNSSPQLFTDIDDTLNDVTWNKWTIEVCFKADSLSGHRTFLGRDGESVTANTSVAPLYFKASSAGDSKPLIYFVDLINKEVTITYTT